MAEWARRILSVLKKTPLHPQWFAHVHERTRLKETCRNLRGTILDVGCADSEPRQFLLSGTTYIGLDYYSTAKEWYGTTPDVFGDAQHLPFQDGSINHALLLDVLEHLPDPDRCLAELHRVLRVGGTLTVQVPFIYPIHDAPLDFHRWTRFGLSQAADRSGFSVSDELHIGHPLETAALMTNIALSKSVLNWIRQKNPLALTIVLLPIAFPLANLAAWAFARLGQKDDLMPYSYRVRWIKNQSVPS